MENTYASLPHPNDFKDYLKDNEDWYFNLCYDKIRENFEGDRLEVIDVMSFVFDDEDKTIYDITISRSDFTHNLTNCLRYFEKVEEYGKCSKVNGLIDDIEKEYGL